MKKRDLFVFAGQSNMMGAAVYPTAHIPALSDSYEYKHAPRRRGSAMGDFCPITYPVGEFSYTDLALAYAEEMVDEQQRSRLTDYAANSFFCPSMASLASEEEHAEHCFADFSEATLPRGTSLAPLIAEGWEAMGCRSALAHIAKGGVHIRHFFTVEMRQAFNASLSEYARTHTDGIAPMKTDDGAAGDYFFEKCQDFFLDAAHRFPDEDLSHRCLFWLQGESDAGMPAPLYQRALEILWAACRKVGFTHFFCIRVDFFGKEQILQVMRAQEDFCRVTPNAHLLTRVASYFPYAGRDESSWFVRPPLEDEKDTRDSFLGYPNQHVNEKGFRTIAAHALPNLYRVLREQSEVVLEEENLRGLQ